MLVDDEGRRALVLHRPPFDDAQTDWLPLGEIDRVDAVFADNRWVPGARTILQAARARGVPAVLDADVGTGAETIEAVRCATHTIFSGPALADLYGAESDDLLIQISSGSNPGEPRVTRLTGLKIAA